MMKKLITCAASLIFALCITVNASCSEYAEKLGKKGKTVLNVQTVLENKGYEIRDEKGFFGLETLAAIIAFQEKASLEISGTIDSPTKKLLLGEETVHSNDDLHWLSKIVHAESCGESYEGKLAVANCVLNRVKSDEYPDSIKDVIFDTKYGVQYQPTVNGSIHQTPDDNCTSAAKEALGGNNPIGDCLFFFNPATANNFWISQNREFYTAIGNHHFYL